MADCKKYGRTANLYDKDNDFYSEESALNIQYSHWLIYANSASVKIPCEGGKTYTLSVSTSLPLFRIAESNNVDILPTRNGSPVDIVVNLTDATEYTFTTKSTTQAIIFQGSFSLRETWKNSLMFNEGSTALPYQPYLDWKHSLRKLTTATDTITTLPADLYADGTNASADIIGNMSQSGTPTPTTPIQPSETGERTGNLIDVNVSEAGGISDTGELINNPNTWRSTVYYDIDTTLNYVASKAKQTIRINYYDASKNHISREGVTQDTYKQLTVPSNARYFKWTLYDDNGIPDIQAARSIKPMINLGSTALPYEPYGYKLDIKSASTTTPVYLGEVETTRKIWKLVFDGTEDGWRAGTGFFYNQQISPNYKRSAGNITLMCTHYQPYKQVAQGGAVPNGYCSFYFDPVFQRLYFVDNNIASLADFKTYLQQQYAAGTPVCVWYVLSSATTGIVNEPLRKIGDYADTVSDITIPTITGKDTFDVQTTLKPSEVSLTYTGWHDATVGEWDGSDWQ